MNFVKISGDEGRAKLLGWERLLVTVEKQGDHSTQVPDGLADTLRRALYDALTQDVEVLSMAEDFIRSLHDLLEASIKNGWAWTLQVHSVHIRGDSHFLLGSVRAYMITDFNTVDVIIQPGDASTRRRCQLCLPKLMTPGKKRNCLQGLFTVLAPGNFINPGCMPTAEMCKNRLMRSRLSYARASKKRTPEEKMADFCDSIIRSKARRKELCAMIGDRCAPLTVLEFEDLLKAFWRKYAPADIQNLDRISLDWMVSTSCLVSGIVTEVVGRKFVLGEYGALLYDEALEEREIIATRERDRRKVELTQEIGNVQGRIEKLEGELAIARSTLANLQQESAAL